MRSPIDLQILVRSLPTVSYLPRHTPWLGFTLAQEEDSMNPPCSSGHGLATAIDLTAELVNRLEPGGFPPGVRTH